MTKNKLETTQSLDLLKENIEQSMLFQRMELEFEFYNYISLD